MPEDPTATAGRETRRTTRRVVLGASAWSAPVVVLTTAAPATAASGQAVVRTMVSQLQHQHNLLYLPVNIVFTNENTQASGPVYIDVTLAPTLGTIRDGQTPRAGGADGIWNFVGTTKATTTPGRPQAYTFSYVRPDGIPGAYNATNEAAVTLNFAVDVTEGAGSTSTGDITASPTIPDGNGTITPSAGTWT